MKRITYLLGFVVIGILVSCEKEVESTITADNTALADVTGHWEVTAYNDSLLIFGPFKVITLEDPSAQSDSITIQDTEVKFWKFQTKAFLDKNDGTFQTELSKCEVSEEAIGIKISNGIIFNSDSIYFEIQFEDDITPFENTYKLKGHRIKG